MSVNLAWDAPMQLHSTFELVDDLDLYINVQVNVPLASGLLPFWRILDPRDYSIVPGKFRSVVDSLSQADGSSIQPPYIDGMVATMSVAFQTLAPSGDLESALPACDADLREMNQLLMGVLNSLRTYPADVSTQQYLWLPPGLGTNRLLDGVMLASWPTPDFSNTPEVRLKFSLGSPYPYALTDAPHTNPLDGTTAGYLAPGSTMMVANNGNVMGLPIVRAYGLGTNFVLTNLNTGYQISYDSSRPGALPIPSGQYLEFDFHEGSCLLNGDPNFDYIAGMNPATDDFWGLNIGETSVRNQSGGDTSIQMVSYDTWV